MEFTEEERIAFYGDKYAANIYYRNKYDVRFHEWRALKRRAHKKVGKAIASGKLVRMPCEVCGKEPSQGHHDDYLKPLEVRWLCSRHHILFHKENGFQTTPPARETEEGPNMSLEMV